MSDQERTRSVIKSIGLILLISAFALASFGTVWWLNGTSRVENQESSENANLVDNHPSISTTTPGSLKFSSAPTTAAPVPPTAVSTSLPQPTHFPLPELNNALVEQFTQEAEIWQAEFIKLDSENTGIWQFQPNSFVHPLALEVSQSMAFLLDGGRVMTIDINKPQEPQLLLAPGFEIDGVQVLEPLDLAATPSSLLVLDRAGDVYRYDLANQTWHIDRYDRPVEASSGHYFVALDGVADATELEVSGSQTRALLETNYKFAMLYGGETTPLWNLPDGRSVDLGVQGNDVYVIQRATHDNTGNITKYTDTRLIESFTPSIEIEKPRQLVATESAVYILDQEGRRLRSLNPIDGSLLRVYQVPQLDPVTAFAINEDEELILAARDRLYYFEHPEKLAVISGSQAIDTVRPHDPMFLASLDEYTVPIGGSNITFRDFQLPGAPRHYRLGVHQGIDFYWQPGTKILAAADGVIIRADIDYVPPTAFQLSAWWAESQKLGYTTSETLDNYLGRQVWIEHSNGIVSRYSHLRSIEPDISEGTLVTQGQVIGEVGNSGSPASLESEKADAHLHFELWAGDYYIGQFLRPIEVREWVEKILTHQN